MRLLAEGMSLTEIADALGIGYKTVANACSHIKAKLRGDTNERVGAPGNDAGGRLN